MKALLQPPMVTDMRTLHSWNNWIPLKINIFRWRTLQERIPKALTRRGIQVDTTLFGNYEDDMEHILTARESTAQIWNRVATWIKLPPIFVFSVNDLLSPHEPLYQPNTSRKLRQAIILTTAWCIWKAHNNLYTITNQFISKDYFKRSNTFHIFGSKTGRNFVIYIGWIGVIILFNLLYGF